MSLSPHTPPPPPPPVTSAQTALMRWVTNTARRDGEDPTVLLTQLLKQLTALDASAPGLPFLTLFAQVRRPRHWDETGTIVLATLVAGASLLLLCLCSLVALLHH